MLSLAQLNTKKFRKNVTNIDIRSTVEDIMKVQMQKAETIGIDLKASFKGFDDQFLVATDEMRLQ
jgi:hypothetical protein